MPDEEFQTVYNNRMTEGIYKRILFNRDDFCILLVGQMKYVDVILMRLVCIDIKIHLFMWKEWKPVTLNISYLPNL